MSLLVFSAEAMGGSKSEVDGLPDSLIISFSPEDDDSAIKHESIEIYKEAFKTFMEGPSKADEAIALFDKYIKKAPVRSGLIDEAYYYKAFILFKTNRLKQALKNIDKSLKHKQESENAWALKAVILSIFGDKSGAIDANNKTLEINPDHAGALGNMGHIMMSSKNYEEAFVFFDRLVVQKRDANSLSSRASALGALGRTDDAVKDYNDAYKEAKDDADRLVVLESEGYMLMKVDRDKEAFKVFKKALKINPKSPSILNGMGNALMGMGKNKKAVKHLSKVVNIYPDDYVAWYNIACAYARLGSKESAIESLARALELEPGLADSARNDKDFKNIRDEDDFKALMTK